MTDSANPFAAVTSFFENKESGGDNSNVGEKLLKLISDG